MTHAWKFVLILVCAVAGVAMVTDSVSVRRGGCGEAGVRDVHMQLSRVGLRVHRRHPLCMRDCW